MLPKFTCDTRALIGFVMREAAGARSYEHHDDIETFVSLAVDISWGGGYFEPPSLHQPPGALTYSGRTESATSHYSILPAGNRESLKIVDEGYKHRCNVTTTVSPGIVTMVQGGLAYTLSALILSLRNLKAWWESIPTSNFCKVQRSSLIARSQA